MFWRSPLARLATEFLEACRNPFSRPVLMTVLAISVIVAAIQRLAEL